MRESIPPYGEPYVSKCEAGGRGALEKHAKTHEPKCMSGVDEGLWVLKVIKSGNLPLR